MGKHVALPALATAGGAAAFVLRRWQLASAYDEETQLFRSGAPATFALAGLLILLALIFLLSVRGKKGEGPRDFLPAFRCPSPAFMAGMAASAFLFFGAGALTLMEGTSRLSQWRVDPSSVPLTRKAAISWSISPATRMMSAWPFWTSSEAPGSGITPVAAS